MSLRPRRTRTTRGRPPKTPVTSRSSTFLVKKPKFFSEQQQASENSNDSSQFEVPTGSAPGTPSSRSSSRAEARKAREAAQRSRNLMQRVLHTSRHHGDEDSDDDQNDDASSDVYRNYPYSGDEAGSDLETPSASILGVGEPDEDSDPPYNENGSESDYSEASYSTMSSASRRKYILQPPEFDVDEAEIPPLVLPTSSTDLILPSEQILPAMGIYEVLRHFRTILRLSPFRFEDFCAALISDEQCCLLSEIHMSLLRALLREEDGNNTTFGPHDLKDSINVSFLFLDGMTWTELVRSYLDSDKCYEFENALKAITESGDHPFSSTAPKLTVLQTLTDIFLSTNNVREEIMNEGNIQYDDHCRNCHKLGDLLCCETCPAVYHLTCVDPPMEEVPEDDWLCGVCKAHQLEGVIDCVSELEKSGMMSRHDPLGFDRHGRKYWFFSRRLFVEGDNEVWYYSSKYQFEELMENLDPTKWELPLVRAIEDVKEDIIKQMDITEKLTNNARGIKQSVLASENAVVKKIQAERAARRAQEALEKQKTEETKALEEGKKDEESQSTKEEGKEDDLVPPKEGSDSPVGHSEQNSGDKEMEQGDKDTAEKGEEATKDDGLPGPSGDAIQKPHEDMAESVADTDTSDKQKPHEDTAESVAETDTSDKRVEVKMEVDADAGTTAENDASEMMKSDTVQASVTTAESTTTTTATETTTESTTVSQLQGGSDTLAKNMEVVETTTTTTTTTTVKVLQVSAGARLEKANEEPEKMDVDTAIVKKEIEEDEKGGEPEKDKVMADKDASGEKMETEEKSGTEKTHAVDECGDGEKLDTESEGTNGETASNSRATSEASQDRRMITRYRTGSLVPKQFPDSIVSTTASVKMTSKNNIISVNTSTSTSTSVSNANASASDESVLVINKNGDITRVTKSKTSSAASTTTTTTTVKTEQFKLGMEGNYKQYQNQYTTNHLALNKHQHNEDRDKRRYLSHKFSLTPASEFKWNGAIYGSKALCVATLKLSITQLESNIPGSFLHPNWPLHQKIWLSAVQMCDTPQDFGMALAILETSIKPVLFTSVWHEQLGHIKLQRITALEREEMKKRDPRARGPETQPEDYNLVWVKYPRGLRHQVWKQRGEEYRITGNGGWYWVSVTRDGQHTPQDTVGLRAVARKLLARKARQLEALESKNEDEGKKDEESAKMDSDENEGKIEPEKMDVDNVPVEGGEDADTVNEAKNEDGSTENDTDTAKGDKNEGGTTDKGKEQKNGGKSPAEIDKSVGDADKDIDEEMMGDMETDSKKDSRTTEGGCKESSKKSVLLTLSQVSKLYRKVDLVNVTESLQKRDLYPKITKPYSKLDGLLDRRLKQEEWEAKQRRAIQQMIAKRGTAKEIIAKHNAEVLRKKKEGVMEEKTKPEKQYKCYSAACRSSPEHSSCYSASCPKKLRDEKTSDGSEAESEEVDVKREIGLTEGKKDEQTDHDPSDKDSDTKSGKDSPSDNMMDFSGKDPEEKKDGETEKSEVTIKQEPMSDGEESEEKSGNADENAMGSTDKGQEDPTTPGQKKMVNSLVTLLKKVSTEVVKPKDSDDKNVTESESIGTSAIKVEPEEICSETGEVVPQENVTASESRTKDTDGAKDEAKNDKDSGVSKAVKGSTNKSESGKKSHGTLNSPSEMTYAQAVRHLAGLPASKVADILAKMPRERKTRDPLSIMRINRPVVRKGKAKRGALPLVQKFVTKSKKKSILLLEKYDAQRLARKRGMVEASGFNYNCKMNNVNWNYPCPRPTFKTAWRYRTQNLLSYSAAALHLRILWACLRWDDMNTKPPAGGTNTISTETEITTTELLKRRDVGPSGLRSEFLVRKIIVPIGVPQPQKEKKYTPIRSGLRERKRPESPKQTEPSVTESWVAEERLDLWEIRQFGEKVEKQRQAHAEKATVQKTAIISIPSTTTPVTTTAPSVINIKAQLEEQLKNQRLVLQAKRLNEQMKMTTSTATVVSTPKTITIPVSRSLGGTGGTPIIRRITVQPRPTSTPILKAAVVGTTPTTAVGVTTVRTVLTPRTKTIQLPGTTITVKPTSTVTLAPKATTGSTASTVTTASVGSLKTIAPGTQLPVKSTTPIQVRPANPGVQNLQIIQTTSGQLQVRGLLPGQQLIRLADGRLQLVTLPTNQTQQAVRIPAPAASSILTTPVTAQPQTTQIGSNPPSTPSAPAVVPSITAVPKPTLQVVSGGQIVQVSPAAVKTTTVTATTPVQPKIITVTQVPRIANQLTGPSGPQVITAAQAAPQVATTRAVSLVSQQPQQASSLITPNPQITASKLLGARLQEQVASSSQTVLVSQPQPALLSPVRPTTTVVSVSSPMPNMPTVTKTVSPTQSILSTLGITSPTTSPTAQNVPAKTIIPMSVPAPQQTVTVAATAPPRYAVTPQVVQQVVRQALLQNQTPEIQAKLLAMQKRIATPKGGAIPVQQQNLTVQKQREKMREQQILLQHQQLKQAYMLESYRKHKASQEKDDQPKEKKAKKQMSSEERQKKVASAKLQTLLYKQKEALKRDILKKRGILEKKMQQEITSEIVTEHKRIKANKKKAMNKKRKEEAAAAAAASAGTSIPAASISSFVGMNDGDPLKKKKQKIISTGNARSRRENETLYCVCRQPYDDGKFYIGCDLCSNWFHGNCVEITEEQAKFMDSYICEDCKRARDDTSEELYCLCRTPYDESQFYIGCDRCQDWFHGRCVGITKCEADGLDTYICPNCQKSNQTHHAANKKVLIDKDFDVLRRLVKGMQTHKMAWPFIEPVDPEEVPDYYDIIKEPMDLHTLEKKVSSHEYITLGDFTKDVMRIFDNCRYYNPNDSPFFQCAEVLETHFVQKLKTLKEKIMHSH